MAVLTSALQIHYWERDRQNQTEKVKVIFVPDTHVHLANLTSYTPYLVTLSAFNTAGDGPPSDPRGTRTLQAGESSSGFCFFCFFFFASPFLPIYLSFFPRAAQRPASPASCPSRR